jgi:hypothetical protein
MKGRGTGKTEKREVTRRERNVKIGKRKGEIRMTKEKERKKEGIGQGPGNSNFSSKFLPIPRSLPTILQSLKASTASA